MVLSYRVWNMLLYNQAAPTLQCLAKAGLYYTKSPDCLGSGADPGDFLPFI